METLPLTEEIRMQMRRYRMAAGHSQLDMAELLYMDERNYKRIESGQRKIIDLELVERFCHALSIPVHDFVRSSAIPPHEHILAMQQWAAMHQLRKTLQTLEQLLQPPPLPDAAG